MKRNYLLLFALFLVPFIGNGQNSKMKTAPVKSRFGSLTSSKNLAIVPGIFYTEDFSGGAVPSGWAQEDNTGSGLFWTWTTTGSANNYGALDTAGTTAENGYLIIDSDGQNASSGGENTDLITTAIDASGHPAVRLTFNQYFRQYASSRGTVYVSSDSINWTQVYQVGAGLAMHQGVNPENVNIDISTIAANQPKVYLKFKYTGDYDYFWQIDDIQLYEPSAVDAGVIAVSVPSGCDITGTMPVTIMIKNFGVDSLSNFDVSYTVDGGTPVTETFTDTIAPDDTLTFTFTTSADMSTPGQYSFLAFTSVTNDADNNNDTSFVTAEHVVASNLSTPVVMGFESTDDFSGWDTEEDIDGDGLTWNTYSGPADLIHTGAAFHALGLYPATTQPNDWFFSKCLSLKASNTYNIKFYKRTYDNTYDGLLGVFVGNDQAEGAMTQTVSGPSNVDNITYALDSANFTVAIDGVYFIGFQGTKSSTTKGTAIVIDDITITDLGITVDISETSTSSVLVYPNPASNRLNIQIENEKATITVYNVLGELITSSTAKKGLNTISLDNMPEGSYIIKIQSNNEVITKSFIVTK